MSQAPLLRLPDWPERLIEYIASREYRVFEWGKNGHDCCSFGSGGVIAITGQDLMADIPDYASAEEADAILLTPLAELIDQRLPRRPIGLAQRGDIGLAELGGLDTVVIVEGETIVGPGKRRLQRLPRQMMTIAWAV